MPIPSERERKLLQLIIERLNGDDIHDGRYRERMLDLARRGIGGFIVFGGEREGIKEFISELNAAAEIPLFIASDIERGVGQQISGTTPFPCPMAVAAAVHMDDAAQRSFLEEALLNVALEAAYIGINMPLMPVVDVNANADNPIICTRAFSDDPHRVAFFGSLYVKALEGAGLISCPKHFPGHGDTSVDSHIALPVISKSYEQLKTCDLAPFVLTILTGARSIMVGHIALPGLDALPASLSHKIITGVLRQDMGFSGLVLTDALNMSALKDFGNVPAACLNAGVDILLHPAEVGEMVWELDDALTKGDLDESVVDDRLGRIISLKEEVCFGAGNKEMPGENAYSSYRGLVEASITLVKTAPGILPLVSDGNLKVFLCGDVSFNATSPLCRTFTDAVSLNDEIGEGGGAAVFALFTKVAAWRGSSGIPEDETKRIRYLLGRFEKTIVISFGSPYVLRYFEAADILIAAYEGTEAAQESVVRHLLGEASFMGRLPVTIQYEL